MNTFANQEKVCPICGKEFIARDEWVYKRNGRFYCSWHCYRDTSKKKTDRAEQRERICQAIKDGLTNSEIMKLLGEHSATIEYWRRKLKEEKGDA